MDNDEPFRFCRKVQHLRLRPVVQLNELLVPVALDVAPDGRPSQGVQGGEQSCGSVSLIVVRHRRGQSRLHWQALPRPVERSDLRLLADR